MFPQPNEKTTAAPTPEEQTQRECDHFGLCPECRRQGVCICIGRAHWFMCEIHKTCWYVGDNLFRGWREQTPAELESDKKLLETCRVVQAAYYHQSDESEEESAS